MTYILIIWTVVACVPAVCKYDWRPVGEFHQEVLERKISAQEMCENAARQLGLKTNEYRCVRSR